MVPGWYRDGTIEQGCRWFSEVRKCMLFRHSPLQKSPISYPSDLGLIKPPCSGTTIASSIPNDGEGSAGFQRLMPALLSGIRKCTDDNRSDSSRHPLCL